MLNEKGVEDHDPFTVLPFVTFLISTYNRREVLLQTLGELREVDRRCEVITQTIVVDNASTDGTADAVAEQFPSVLVLRQSSNRGACAKNVGLAHATGRYVVFLDDDSFPAIGSIRRMIECFQADPDLGAAVFDVILPDGSHECSAYPKVFIGCGTGFRREALREVGGLPDDFFMQAEEYDLSLRLLDAGWDIRRIDDLQVMHQKTPSSRVPTRTTRLDVRNNLTIITRYFPRQWMWLFALDWMRRYRWIANDKGWRHRIAFWRGVVEGAVRSIKPEHRRAVSLTVFERFAMVREIRRHMEQAIQTGGYRSIALIDVGKNILPYWMAAKACGVEVVAVADNRLARAGRRYRGVPVVSDTDAMQIDFDAAFVANVSPVQAAIRREQWRRLGRCPVIDLFERQRVVEKAVAKVA
jgi:hypothetical protein